MIIKGYDYKTETVENIAKQIVCAAITAPKGRGVNNLESAIIIGDDLEKIAQVMEQIGAREQQEFFFRDAENMRKADALILLGAKIAPLGLAYCGLCGMENCENKNKHKDIPCVFNTGDLGIAIGSAVSIAADFRIDNRVFFTAGMAVREMKIFSDDVKIIYGIGLAVNSKNIFFDRPSKK